MTTSAPGANLDKHIAGEISQFDIKLVMLPHKPVEPVGSEINTRGQQREPFGFEFMNRGSYCLGVFEFEFDADLRNRGEQLQIGSAWTARGGAPSSGGAGLIVPTAVPSGSLIMA